MATSPNTPSTQQTWWEKHADAVITGILVAGITGIATVLWSINKSVSENNIRLTSTEKRMNRIADSLPDFKIRIAEEDVYRKYDFAIVQLNAANETKYPDSKSVLIFDFNENSIQKWVSPTFTDPTLKAVYNSAVIGTASTVSPTSFTLSSLEQSSVEIKNNAMLPTIIDGEVSFIVKGPLDEYIGKLAKMNFRMEEKKLLPEFGITSEDQHKNYHTLVKSLENVSKDYKISR